MTTQEITEGNKLIAEFVPELEVWTGGNPVKIKNWRQPSTLLFDTSWDWLMLVVEKIETIEQDGLYYNFQILGGCSVYIISSNMEEIISVDNGDSKLHNVWLAVVEFIKYYNQNEGNIRG